MSIGKKKISTYQISNISIKENQLSWENHTVWSSGISQVWMGDFPTEPFPAETILLFLFITLSSTHIICIITMLILSAIGIAAWRYYHCPDQTAGWVNIKLHTGDILSFTASNNDTLSHFYNAVNSLADSSNEEEFIFDADGNLPEKPAEEEPEEKHNLMEIDSNGLPDSSLINELQRLYLNYSEKTDSDSEVLQFLNTIFQLIKTGNREELKEAYGNFVTLGLIGNCNELGLNTLIQEIKANIY